MVRLLHLSDIHFRPSEGATLLDVDAAVRTDLLNDLRTIAAQAAPVDAILVVGDIAARGAQEEYARANEFLDEAAEIVNCDRSRVVCVPGNHDVDRSRFSPLHDGLRRLLRTAEPRRVGSELGRVLHNPAAAEVLHQPLANYNTFAAPLGCAVTASEPIWAPKELDLGGRALRIRGVNTALTCDGTESDSSIEHRVILGDVQLAQLSDDHDAISIVLCHHPGSWLRDAEAVERWLARPHLLLTGHVHEMGIVERADGRSATIAAGAVNPERTAAGWQPAYNVLELQVVDDTLIVDVRIRCYTSERTGFGPDARFDDPHRLRIPLSRAAGTPEPVTEPLASGRPEPLESDERTSLFKVMTSSPDRRERAARALGLLTDAERLNTLDDEQRFIERARSTNRLREVAEAIDHV